MKNCYFLTLGVAALTMSGFLVYAQQPDPLAEVTFPVPELGNCANQAVCEAYRDRPESMEAYLDFVKQQVLCRLKWRLWLGKWRAGSRRLPGRRRMPSSL